MIDTPKLRVCGDVHGNYREYFEIINGCDYSVQVGDMGYNYEPLKGLSHNHKFFFGNHDAHNLDLKPIQWLGLYGYREVNNVKFFFISGAFSIDKWVRIKYEEAGLWPKTWFENEQLNEEQFNEAIKSYEEIKPDIVFTHDCPSVISRQIGNPSILRSFGYDPDSFNTVTQVALDECFKKHQPKLWVFGHYHISRQLTVDGTKFVCLPECGFIDINEKGEIL